MSKRKQELEARLEGRQKIAALLCVEREMSDEENRKGFDEIAEEVGVSRQSIYNWRTQNRTFIEYVNLLADDFLESKQAVVYRRLMQLIDPAGGQLPSVKAIDLYLRKHGKLTDHRVIETKNGDGGRSNDDIAADIEALDEILEDGDRA